MNEERDRRIRVLLERGVPKVKVAEQLGIDRATVSRAAARLGFPAAKRGSDAHDWNRIRDFYVAGHSAAETQRQFKFGAATWAAAIARGEIRPRPRDYPEKPPGETRRKVEALLNQGLGITDVAERLRISKPTVCYHARKLGVPAKRKFARRHDWEAIQDAHDSGMSMRACKRHFGFSSDAWYDAVKRGELVPRDHRIPLEQLLVVGRRTSRGHLKTRLIDAGLKEDRCEICGITEWMGKPVRMQLHHKNGDGLDNRLENIQFLCANCHSQTDTYGGRNGHRKPKPNLRLIKGEAA